MDLINRFDVATPLNDAPAKPKRTRKPRAPKEAAASPVPCLPATPTPVVGSGAKSKALTRYALAGVVLMSALSAGLNGFANAQHSPVAWAGWVMGLAIPMIILILGKVAGILQTRGHRHLALTTAGAGIGLLALSVWHCATSISLLTGSPVVLALPMAVAIDVGFVCCELAVLADE
jgi:hypothetical protein